MPRHDSELQGAPLFRNGRPSIGFLSASIHTGASRDVWAGVVKGAREARVNLVCLPGGRLGAPFNYESQRNRLYDLASSAGFDGLLVWTTSLEGFVGDEEIEELLGRLSGPPLLGLHRPGAGAPYLSFDAYGGMRDLIEHLIQAHGHKEIAFIRGPASHHSAEDRFRAYRDALAAHGIPLRADLVSEPQPWDTGPDTLKVFLEEGRARPGSDYRALAAASDLLAFTAARILQGRGLRIPSDIAVTGFNDSLESRLATPALSTVAVDFREEGRAAVALLAAMIEGKAIPPRTALPVRLTLRTSCGCPASPLRKAVIPRLPASPEEEASFSDFLSRESGLPPGSVRAILRAFCHDWPSFLPSIEGLLEDADPLYLDSSAWQACLSLIRQAWLLDASWAGRPDGSTGLLAAGESLFHEARIIAAEAYSRAFARRRWTEESKAEQLREIGNAMTIARDVEAVARTLARSLAGLGIPSAFLVLEDEGAEGLGRLVLAYRGGAEEGLPRGGLPFPSARLLPEEFLEGDAAGGFVVEALFHRDRRLGYVLFELGPADGSIYEELRGHIAAALEGARLVSEADAARSRAEKADGIKTRLLSSLSRELSAPLKRMARIAGELSGNAAPQEIALRDSLAALRHEAEKEGRLVEELLELSRAELGELDLNPALVDVGALVGTLPRLRLFPGKTDARLPILRTDSALLERLFKAILDLAPPESPLDLVCSLEPPDLVFRFSPPLSAPLREAWSGLAEPEGGEEGVFFAAEYGGGGRSIRLVLGRRLAAILGGRLESPAMPGDPVELRLPLPSLGGHRPRSQPHGCLMLAGSASSPPPELEERARAQGFFAAARAQDLGSLKPAPGISLITWEPDGEHAPNLELIGALARHPRFLSLPLVLYGSPARTRPERPELDGLGLLGLLSAAFPRHLAASLRLLTQSRDLRDEISQAVHARLPGLGISCWPGLEDAVREAASDGAGLWVVDMDAPGLDPCEIFDRLRFGPSRAASAFLVLGSKPPDARTMSRLLLEPRVRFQLAGVWYSEELGAVLEGLLSGAEWLPAPTAALAKKALLFLAEHSSEPLSRWRLAEAVGANEDYLTRIFGKEYGLSPWECLNRIRVNKAKTLLAESSAGIAEVGARVGFREQAYFCRVFKKLSGLSPQEWRKSARPGRGRQKSE